MHSVKFEDALNMTGFGRYNIVMQLLNITLIMGITFEIASVAYIVPASACELNTTNFQQGIIAGIPLLGMMATSHLGGYLADTRGRRKVLFWSMTLGFLFGSLSSLSPDWKVLGVLKFLSSSAVAGNYGLAVTLLGECTPQHKRSIVVALTSATFVSWMGLMAVLCIPVLQLKFMYHIPFLNIDFSAWRLLTILYASPCALGAIGICFAHESPRYLLSIGEEKQAIKVLKTIYTCNTGKSGDDFNVSSLVLGEDTGKPMRGFWSSVVSQTIPLLQPPLLKNTILLSITFFVIYFGLFPFLTWLPYTADSVMRSLESGRGNLTICNMMTLGYTENLSKKDCSFNSNAMLTVFTICIIIAALNIVLSTVVNYIGKKRLLVTVQLISGTAGLCINFTSSWILGTIFLIVFMSGVVNFGVLSIFSVNVFPTYVKAMGVVLTLMVGRIGSVLGINILKYLLVYNCEIAFYTYGGLIFVGGLIGFMLPGDIKTENNSNKLETNTIKVSESSTH